MKIGIVTPRHLADTELIVFAKTVDALGRDDLGAASRESGRLSRSAETAGRVRDASPVNPTRTLAFASCSQLFGYSKAPVDQGFNRKVALENVRVTSSLAAGSPDQPVRASCHRRHCSRPGYFAACLGGSRSADGGMTSTGHSDRRNSRRAVPPKWWR